MSRSNVFLPCARCETPTGQSFGGVPICDGCIRDMATKNEVEYLHAALREMTVRCQEAELALIALAAPVEGLVAAAQWEIAPAVKAALIKALEPARSLARVLGKRAA